MRKLITTLLSLFFSLFLFAQNTQSLFEQGNAAYGEKDYEAAIEKYEAVQSAGYESAALYYNLGNAYFKTGKLAPAILNFEKAKKIDPSDEDILFNLKLANLRVADRIESTPRLFFVQWANNILVSRASNGWAYYALGLVWLAFTLGAIYLLAKVFWIRRLSFFLSLLVLLVSFASLFLSLRQMRYETHEQEAIVFVTNTYVKSAPDPESVDLFILREGVKVEVLESQGDWQRVRLADGKVGWMKQDKLRTI